MFDAESENAVNPKARTERLDERLVHAGLCGDLREATGLVMAGKVMVGDVALSRQQGGGVGDGVREGHLEEASRQRHK